MVIFVRDCVTGFPWNREYPSVFSLKWYLIFKISFFFFNQKSHCLKSNKEIALTLILSTNRYSDRLCDGNQHLPHPNFYRSSCSWPPASWGSSAQPKAPVLESMKNIVRCNPPRIVRLPQSSLLWSAKCRRVYIPIIFLAVSHLQSTSTWRKTFAAQLSVGRLLFSFLIAIFRYKQT